jgi:hypothetical protein
MTEKQFQELVQRQAQPQFGVPSQTRTDLGDLISEITRRGPEGFEPEPKTEEELAAEAAETDASPKKAAKKR